MRYSKTLLALILAIFIFVPDISVGAEGQVDFSWGFFLRKADGQVRSLDFKGQEPVSSGDLLRVYLQLHEHSFVYLFLYDSRGDLYQVFPPSPDFYEHAFPSWQRYYIPSSREWFTLDESKGAEKFFLLASNERLRDLEQLAKSVIFERNEEYAFKQAAEIIEKKVLGMMHGRSAEVDSIPVAHTAKLGPANESKGITVNRTAVPGPYGLILELINQ